MSSAPLNEIIKLLKAKAFSWATAEQLLQIQDSTNWTDFFNTIEPIIWQNRIKRLKSYTPGKNFPAISVTASECALNCEHCDKKYLHSMLQAPTEDQFKTVLADLKQKKQMGALISGGCTENGIVPVLKYAQSIQAIKKENSLTFNSHVGLVSAEEAGELKHCGIDFVSFDLILDPTVISDVFHLQKTPQDYIRSYEALRSVGLRVIPHVLIGANFGKISHELKTLQYLAKNPPELLVFIAMIPPNAQEGAKISKFINISPEIVPKFCLIAHTLLPNTEISLGCMRPKDSHTREVEQWTIQAGVSRMEIPNLQTIKWAKTHKFDIKYYAACCAIPENLENRFESENILGKIKP